MTIATPENIGALLGIKPRQSDNPEPEAQPEQPVEVEQPVTTQVVTDKRRSNVELVNRAEIAALGALEAKRRQALAGIHWTLGDEWR